MSNSQNFFKIQPYYSEKKNLKKLYKSITAAHKKYRVKKLFHSVKNRNNSKSRQDSKNYQNILKTIGI